MCSKSTTHRSRVVVVNLTVFWYHSNSMTNRERTKRCPVVYGSKIWAILYVIIGKINNMLLYVKFMLICAYGMY